MCLLINCMTSSTNTEHFYIRLTLYLLKRFKHFKYYMRIISKYDQKVNFFSKHDQKVKLVSKHDQIVKLLSKHN